LRARSEFDEHENLVRSTEFREDGTPEQEQIWRYQYSREGNTTEQLLVRPNEPQTTYRSVFIRDDDGRLREQAHYWPNGALNEKKVFDEGGVLREEQFSLGRGHLSKSSFDAHGCVFQIRVVSPAGFLSSRGADYVMAFEYDLHGNQIKTNTTASDGTLLSRVTNSYGYDEKGNWIEQTVVDLTQDWQRKPFPASFESIWQFTRKLDYFDA